MHVTGDAEQTCARHEQQPPIGANAPNSSSCPRGAERNGAPMLA